MRKTKYKLNLTEDARRRIGWRRGLSLTKVTKYCEVCGTPFQTVPSSSKQHCCSRKCQFERLSKTKPILVCPICKQSFSPKSHKPKATFCSRKCAVRSRYINHIYKIRPSTILPRREMKQCEMCGYDTVPQILERHHKDFDHKNNSRNNLQTLCPNCHDALHYCTGNGLKHKQVHD